MSEEKWKYKGKFVQVSEVEKEGQTWEKVYLCGGLVIYPLNDKGEVLLIKEYRPHETPQIRLKPVTGIYENQYDFEGNVQREMQEEIGFKAGKIDKILEIKSSGTINNFQYFALARDLEVSKLPNPDGEDTIREILAMSLDDLYAKLMSGEIPLRNAFIGIFKLIDTSYSPKFLE